MRRTDREVTDFSEITSVIDSCRVIRLGFCDGDLPYIVPVNFAYKISTTNETERADGDGTERLDCDKNIKIEFFIHGAKSGRKADFINKNKVCSFEMDCDHVLEPLPAIKNITMRYKCVMGKARITVLEGEDKLLAMQKMVERYMKTKHFDWNRMALPGTLVCRLDVMELTCKINRPGTDANQKDEK